MKSCVIFGNLTSDKTDEQYPTENYCDECYEKMTTNIDDEGESPIVNVVESDLCHGQTCYNCGADLDEE